MNKIHSIDPLQVKSPETYLVQEGLLSPNSLHKSITIQGEFNEDSETFYFGDSICYRVSRYSREADVYELSRLEAFGLINALVANQFGDLRTFI